MSDILERKIHDDILALIEKNEFGNKISEKSELYAAIDTLKNQEFIPSFSLDYLGRRKLLNSAGYILPKLNLLDLVSSDKSISREKGEVLRPDIVAYNPEENCFVIVEVKKEKQTARETMTELMAYEQEIQNHMPFCSNLDVLYVVVSPEWSTLLDHSIVSAVTWSSRKILALNYDVDTGDVSIYLPDAWSRLGTPLLPQDGGPTVTLICDGLNSDEPEQALFNAIDLLKEFADRENISGFCYLWRDWHPLFGNKWNISVCIVNPVEIYKQSAFEKLNQRKTPLSNYIENNICDLEKYYPSSMFEAANSAKDYLDKFCNARYEGLSSWYIDLEENRFRSMPVEFRFFGEFAAFTRGLVANEGFWSLNVESLELSQHGFSDPMVAVPFIDSLFGKSFLDSGKLTLSECAKIGKVISVIFMALNNYIAAKNESLEKKTYFLCICRWYQFSLISIVNEIKILERSSSDKLLSPPVLKISDNQEALDSLSEYKAWLIEDLIGSEFPLHQHILELACNVGFIEDKTFGEIVSNAEVSKILLDCSQAINLLSSHLSSLRHTYVCDNEVRLSEALHLKIVNAFEDELKSIDSKELVYCILNEMPKFLDLVVYPVFFNLNGIDLTNIDWQEIKRTYIYHVESGKNDVCVSLMPNGDVGISRHDMAALMMKNISPENSFLFLNESHCAGLIRIISWSSIQDGTFFREMLQAED